MDELQDICKPVRAKLDEIVEKTEWRFGIWNKTRSAFIGGGSEASSSSSSAAASSVSRSPSPVPLNFASRAKRSLIELYETCAGSGDTALWDAADIVEQCWVESNGQPRARRHALDAVIAVTKRRKLNLD